MTYSKDEYGDWWCQYSTHRTRCAEFTCQKCGIKFVRPPSKSKKILYCSMMCRNKATGDLHRVTRKGDKNPNWKGGRKMDSGGYIRIYLPDHPYCETHRFSIPEHRVVMEKMIGRYLLPSETVHHKNGVRHDNRPENLQLFVSRHPPGQTPSDLVKWANEILLLYKNIPSF